MAKQPVKMGWLDRIVEVHWNGKFYILAVTMSTSPVEMFTHVTGVFDDGEIGQVMNGLQDIPARGFPQKGVPIVNPPTKEMKQAYEKWRIHTLVETITPSEGGNPQYQINDAGAYFNLTKLKRNKMTVNVTVGDFTGSDLSFGLSGELIDPDGNVIAQGSQGGAGIDQATAVFTVKADVKARTCVVTRDPDPQ